MEKDFNSIAFEIPEGYWPSYYELEGRMLRVYLTNQNPNRWEIKEPYNFGVTER